jgi:hypothetical protein
MNASTSDSLTKARAAVDALRKIAADSPVAGKVADLLDLLEGLEDRLSKVESSFVESARSAPMHLRKG